MDGYFIFYGYRNDKRLTETKNMDENAPSGPRIQEKMKTEKAGT